MAENAVVRARIDESIKNEASLVLATMGLTVSDAFRLLLTRVALEKCLPFDIRLPVDVVMCEKAKSMGQVQAESYSSNSSPAD